MRRLLAAILLLLAATQAVAGPRTYLVTTTDPRLSDARLPLPHTQDASTVTGLATVATSGSYSDLNNQPFFTRGYDGHEVEVRNDGTYVQWRYVSDPPSPWINLIALSAITGPPGSNGTNGTNGADGADGKTYSCAITGGIRTLEYDKNGANPVPTMTAFAVELRENGSMVTPATYSWTTPVTSLLSGSGSAATFTPAVAGTFVAATDNRVDVAVTYAGTTCRTTAPVPATKIGADGQQGSADTKQQIYTKISVGTTGDVLRTQCGSGDLASFAAREVRDSSGNIILTYTCGGQVTVYNLPSDTATTIKLLVKKSDGSNGLVYKAGGSLVLY